MTTLRNRARLFAAIALAWHMMTIAAVSTVLSCDARPAVEHAGMAGHEGMVDCPMKRQEPVCPLHSDQHGTHDCDCPTLECSQTGTGFAALFGVVGILPAMVSINAPDAVGDATPIMSASATRLAPVPIAPPPRS